MFEVFAHRPSSVPSLSCCKVVSPRHKSTTLFPNPSLSVGPREQLPKSKHGVKGPARSLYSVSHPSPLHALSSAPPAQQHLPQSNPLSSLCTHLFLGVKILSHLFWKAPSKAPFLWHHLAWVRVPFPALFHPNTHHTVNSLFKSHLIFVSGYTPKDPLCPSFL